MDICALQSQSRIPLQSWSKSQRGLSERPNYAANADGSFLRACVFEQSIDTCSAALYVGKCLVQGLDQALGEMLLRAAGAQILQVATKDRLDPGVDRA